MVVLLRWVVIGFFLSVVFSGIAIVQCLSQEYINIWVLVLSIIVLSSGIFMLLKINRMLIKNPELMIEQKTTKIKTTRIIIKNQV